MQWENVEKVWLMTLDELASFLEESPHLNDLYCRANCDTITLADYLQSLYGYDQREEAR